MIGTGVRWYHLVLGHPGRQRLYDTINARFYYPGLSTICQQYQCPDDCEMIKNQGRQYGHLAAREVNIAPWHTVAVDLIGPWKTVVNGQTLEFKALTIMDTVTNLLVTLYDATYMQYYATYNIQCDVQYNVTSTMSININNRSH